MFIKQYFNEFPPLLQKSHTEENRRQLLLDAEETKQLESLMFREKAFQQGISRIHTLKEAYVSSF